MNRQRRYFNGQGYYVYIIDRPFYSLTLLAKDCLTKHLTTHAVLQFLGNKSQSVIRAVYLEACVESPVGHC